MGKTDCKTVGIVLLCIALAAVYFGKIPIGPTTTAPPVTTIAPPVPGIPAGMQPMDWNVKLFNKLYDENDDNETVDANVEAYMFLTDPRAINPRGSVRAMVEVIDDAIDNSLYYTSNVGTPTFSAYVELLSSGEITELIQKGVTGVYVVLWDASFWGATSGYASAVDWWDVHYIPMSDIVKWQNDQVTIVDYNDSKTGLSTSPQAIKPIGDATLGTAATTTTTLTVAVTWSSCVDATADTNDVGEWTPHYDQPVVMKITTVGFTAGTDSIDDVQYNGNSIWFDQIGSSQVYIAYLTESMIGDGSDGSLRMKDIVVTYTIAGAEDETMDIELYAGGIAGWKFPYPGYNHSYTQPGNMSATTTMGPSMIALGATALYADV